MKNITINRGHYDLMKELSDKQAGEFIKGVCAYAFEGKPFVTKDKYLKGLFVYAKRALDASEMNSINGKKGAEKRIENERRNAAIGMIVGSVMVASAAKKDNSGK